ncbi:hypothetical protein B9T62_31120 [Paenibacillus donghaensis]|uniref:Uncharacterized protein n=1 Tax=Paenibacillus donghaensis TaxID=414771 RepID=A0A2Z2KMT9_9BACL|nr:hypothetical protein B9T62_31120 [Paenibacillus donghaensis]
MICRLADAWADRYAGFHTINDPYISRRNGCRLFQRTAKPFLLVGRDSLERSGHGYPDASGWAVVAVRNTMMEKIVEIWHVAFTCFVSRVHAAYAIMAAIRAEETLMKAHSKLCGRCVHQWLNRGLVS